MSYGSKLHSIAPKPPTVLSSLALERGQQHNASIINCNLGGTLFQVIKRCKGQFG